MAEGMQESHSHLVLTYKPGFPRGSLVQLRDGAYYEHSHLWYVSTDPVSFTKDEVAPLTERECILLDSIGEDPSDRYTVYKHEYVGAISEKLDWALQLHVGDQVSVHLPAADLDEDFTASAVIRSIGVQEKFGWRHLFGVEMVRLLNNDIRDLLQSRLHWTTFLI